MRLTLEHQGEKMANETFLQIPNDVDDPVVLRRVLTAMVETIDEMKGNRGDDKLASESQLISTATSLNDLVGDVNRLDNSFLRRDGKAPALAPISYDKKYKLVGLNFADVNHVTEAVVAGVATIDLSIYVVENTEPAPDLLGGNLDPSAMSAKIDELINVTKLE